MELAFYVTAAFFSAIAVIALLVAAMYAYEGKRARKSFMEDVREMGLRVPPKGTCQHDKPKDWWCSREAGHTGPCALWPREAKPTCGYCRRVIDGPCITSSCAEECLR